MLLSQVISLRLRLSVITSTFRNRGHGTWSSKFGSSKIVGKQACKPNWKVSVLAKCSRSKERMGTAAENEQFLGDCCLIEIDNGAVLDLSNHVAIRGNLGM
jgi:hypothetical protein